MVGTTATCNQGGPLGLAFGYVALHPVALTLSDKRAHLGVGVERIADPHDREGTGQGLDHLIVTPAGDNNSSQG